MRFFPFSLFPSFYSFFLAAMLSTLPPFDPFLNNPFLSCPSPSPGPGPSPDLLFLISQDHNNHKAKPGSPEDNAVVVVEPKRVMEERKRRRMISNRESARRSRMRKQKHLVNLRFQVNRFRMENRELNHKLQFLVHHRNRVRTENDWLRSEQTRLRQRLYNITQILVLQPFSSSAWPCTNTINNNHIYN